MKSYLLKWAFAGLAVPAVLILAHQLVVVPDQLVVALWPSAIALMALDTSQPASIWYVICIWSVSLSLSVILYVVIGLVLRLATKIIGKASESNS